MWLQNPKIGFLIWKGKLNEYLAAIYEKCTKWSKKIEKYSNNNALKQKIAKKGRDKYFKYFNSTIVAEFIINKSFNINKKYFWEKKNKN